MRYLIAVIDDQTGSATPDEMESINGFNEHLRAEGHWVLAAGIGAPSTATVIDNRGGQGTHTAGPFLESTEYMSGFWVIEAPDHQVALALAAEASRSCNRKVELRPFLGG